MKTLLIESMNQVDIEQFNKKTKIKIGIFNIQIQNTQKNSEPHLEEIEDYLNEKIKEDIYLESFVYSEYENIMAQEKARSFHNIVIDLYSFYETSFKNLCELKSLPTNQCPRRQSFPQYLLSQLNIPRNIVPTTNNVDVFRLLRNSIIHNDATCQSNHWKNEIINGVIIYKQDHETLIIFTELQFRIIHEDLVQFYINDIDTIISNISENLQTP